jgi:hypothetical protein
MKPKSVDYTKILKITGHGVGLQGYYDKEDRGNTRWKAATLQSIFIDTKILKEDELFIPKQNTRSATGNIGIRGIVRDMHPLGQSCANAPIVIAFTESWFWNMIVDVVSQPPKHKLSIPAGMKIEPHLPSIISSLRHEADFARKNLIAREKD